MIHCDKYPKKRLHRNTLAELFDLDVHHILWHKSAPAPLLCPLISIFTDFASSFTPVYLFFHFHSLSSCAALALQFCRPLSLPITAALMKVRTSLNQSDGRRGGDNKRHEQREKTETEGAHGRWLTPADLICCVFFNTQVFNLRNAFRGKLWSVNVALYHCIYHNYRHYCHYSFPAALSSSSCR